MSLNQWLISGLKERFQEQIRELKVKFENERLAIDSDSRAKEESLKEILEELKRSIDGLENMHEKQATLIENEYTEKINNVSERSLIKEKQLDEIKEKYQAKINQLNANKEKSVLLTRRIEQIFKDRNKLMEGKEEQLNKKPINSYPHE